MIGDIATHKITKEEESQTFLSSRLLNVWSLDTPLTPPGSLLKAESQAPPQTY